MAIVVNFLGIKLVAPSGSGNWTCTKCNSERGWNIYGPIPTKTLNVEDGWVMYSSKGCISCGYSEVINEEAREDFLKRAKKQ